MAFPGRLRPKGVLFSGFRYMKGCTWGFRSWSIRKGREICHCDLWEDLKWLTGTIIPPATRAMKKTRKLPGLLWFIHIQKTVHLPQLKRMQHSKLGMWKRYHLSMKDIRMGTGQKWTIIGLKCVWPVNINGRPKLFWALSLHHRYYNHR